MAGIGVGLLAAVIALTTGLMTEPKVLMYERLDLKEASEVTAALDQAGVKYEVKGDGSTIYVERDKVASSRLLVAGKGLVTSGSVGYEIFDQTSALGQTDFVQQINNKRALEGELQRTIKGFHGINDVRVMLNIPKRQLFEDEAGNPTASVSINVAGRKPGQEQVQAIQNFVAGAVDGLKPENVAVVDMKDGKTLAALGQGGALGAIADDRKAQIERDLAERIRQQVEGVVGTGKARVEVSAEIDMAQVTEQKKTYDPDGQVIRSEQTSEQASEEADGSNTDAVTASGNIPGGGANPAFLPTNKNTTKGNSTVTNYEISETTRTEILAPGTVQKLSVAVAVDGVTGPGANGKAGPYTPRTEAEMAKLNELVRAAVGFNEGRGDVVKVINVPFARDEALASDGKGGMFDFTKNDLIRFAELGLGAIVVMLLLFFGLRPLLKSLNQPGTGGPMPMLAGAAGGMAPLTQGQAQQIQVDPVTGEMLALPSDMDQRIDIARIEGQVKASSVKRVSEFVDTHPEESVSILRTWLHETA
ncbi:flagellar basal-body MS-ring/collar protein FliF [Caulobacter sp. NIBR1757]|uniref:flagellar basal-body MS-ring/collar protein FliF n=1 Tax=Caulobacter sp. NIBR1757 TaxID=3016000 RepID=UPI0022F11B95|nr:flagellar basal-body MS-ring/collar protein FliF [Caulobacter sp. NIBR1757]WGM37578.1 Flagellar M-ring protein [Caulobacter sp. NIBR1757]